MVQIIEAVYENGVLRPLQPLGGVADQDHVMITINTGFLPHRLAELFKPLPEENADEMISIIEAEFETVNPDDWK